MKPYIVRPNKYNELDNHRFIVMAETELDLFKTLHEMVQNPRGYEFYEVKKEGLALGLYYSTVNDSGDTWREPTTYHQSHMLSYFFTMENSYPWLGFSDKIEYEAYNNLED